MNLQKFEYRKPTLKDLFTTDFDVLHKIIKIWYNIKIKYKSNINIQHVKGHQDKSKTLLSEYASLNIQADRLATESLSMRQQPKKFEIFGDSTLIVNGLTVTSGHTKVMRDISSSMDLREYLQMTNNWGNNEIDNIWWEIYNKSIY
jgi:hypothetical protein